MLHQNDEDTAHYVDSIGFQQVPEFLQEQQTPVFDKLPPEQQQALSDTVQDTLQMLVDADKRIYGDVTGKTLEKQSRRKDIPTRTGSLKSSSRKRPPTAF